MKHGMIFAAVLGATLLGGCVSTSGPSANSSASSRASADAGLDGILAAMMRGESATSGSKLDAALEKAAAFPLGSKDNPVRAQMPPGQRAYLARLRCADGNAPSFNRRGSFGMSPYGNIVDGYDVQCAGSEPAENLIFIDMYHSGHVEDRPVPGYTIVPG